MVRPRGEADEAGAEPTRMLAALDNLLKGKVETQVDRVIEQAIATGAQPGPPLLDIPQSPLAFIGCDAGPDAFVHDGGALQGSPCDRHEPCAEERAANAERSSAVATSQNVARGEEYAARTMPPPQQSTSRRRQSRTSTSCRVQASEPAGGPLHVRTAPEAPPHGTLAPTPSQTPSNSSVYPSEAPEWSGVVGTPEAHPEMGEELLTDALQEAWMAFGEQARLAWRVAAQRLWRAEQARAREAEARHRRAMASLAEEKEQLAASRHVLATRVVAQEGRFDRHCSLVIRMRANAADVLLSARAALAWLAFARAARRARRAVLWMRRWRATEGPRIVLRGWLRAALRTAADARLLKHRRAVNAQAAELCAGTRADNAALRAHAAELTRLLALERQAKATLKQKLLGLIQNNATLTTHAAEQLLDNADRPIDFHNVLPTLIQE